MSGRAAHNGFLLEDLAVCAILLSTAGIASATAGNDARSLQEVIECVKTNEEKLTLIKMNFSADFTSEGKPPSRPRDPRASGRGYKVIHEEIEWAQDGIRQRFVHRYFGDGSLWLSEISVVDGELCKSGDWPDLRRGTIREVSGYTRWLVNYAARLYYRPVYQDLDQWPLLSEVLASSDMMSGVTRQRLGDRDVFVLDIRSGTVGCRRLHIDAERGLLLCSNIYSGPPDTEQAKVVEHMEVTKVQQTDNGGWIALEGRKMDYGEGYARFMHVHVDPNSVSVDRADIPDSLFQLDFLEHTTVMNRILYPVPRGEPDGVATKSSRELHAGAKGAEPNADTPAPSGVQKSNDRSTGGKAEMDQQAREQVPDPDAGTDDSCGRMRTWVMRQPGLLVLVTGIILLVLVLRRAGKK